jgi:1-aminocyclopropane-1-carboxylate deaminase
MTTVETQTGIPLDHVYNAKAMYGLIELIKANHFKKKSKIVYVHTGGLQGLMGLDYMRRK